MACILRPWSTQGIGVVAMNLVTLLLVLLIIALVASFPVWPHSAAWGYYPSGGLGLVVQVLLVLLLTGRL